LFNIAGILLALLISAAGRGQGTLVGWESLAAAGAGVLLILFFYYSIASHLVGRWEWIRLRQRARTDFGPELARALQQESDQLKRRLPAFRISVDVLILALYGVQIFVFGWADYVVQVLGIPLYLDVLPALLPYFLMLAASWAGQYRIERRIHGSSMRPLLYFGLQSRANALTILPILLVYTVYWGLTSHVPLVDELRRSFQLIEVAMQLILVIVVFAFVPVVVRMILPGGRLEDGRLRRRLETFARDRGLKVNQILVWRTGSPFLATAFVIGLIRPFRYVFFTDAILKRLNEDELLAVFAHELGHVHHRHLLWLLLFILSLTVVMLGLALGIERFAPGRGLELPATLAVLAYAYFAFGYISRRFERQADAFAAEHTSPELMASVLLRIGRDNPGAMRKRGWRHFSLQRRVHEIMLRKIRPETQGRFRRELVRGIAIVLGVTLLACVALVQPVREDVVRGVASWNILQFHKERDGRADPQALEDLRTRTLERSASMASLGTEYHALALWYEAQVQMLTGHETDAIDSLIELAREQQGLAETDLDRRRWEEIEADARAARPAAIRAHRDNTSFEAELEKEFTRRGRAPDDG
jgi:STE24 endopeptidase